MRIQETAVAIADIAAYGEELTDAELAEVSGGRPKVTIKPDGTVIIEC